MIAALLGVAIFGGMFVVPLYAFLTTTVDKSQTARTVAANNIVNSGAMVIGSVVAFSLSMAGVGPVGQLLLVAAMCVVAAWLGWKLHRGLRLGEIERNEHEPRDIGQQEQLQIIADQQRGRGHGGSRERLAAAERTRVERRSPGRHGNS